ncbi:hypothetical protein FKM82_028300 [Ascaphus truei]
MAAVGDPVLCIVSRIPRRFRAAQLRHYFSQFTESGGFVCFHYRHRPERRPRDGGSDGGGGPEDVGTCCCLVSVRPERAQAFLQMYAGKPWLDTDGKQVPGRCDIRRVRGGPETDPPDFPYKTRQELQGRSSVEEQRVTLAELRRASELNPPALMQQGNVGTPLGVFLQLIRSCRLPPRLITRLGLRFPGSGRLYARVPFSYAGTEMTRGAERVYTASGQEITAAASTGGSRESEEREPMAESHSEAL